MISAFSRILPIRSTKKHRGCKMENLPAPRKGCGQATSVSEDEHGAIVDVNDEETTRVPAAPDLVNVQDNRLSSVDVDEEQDMIARLLQTEAGEETADVEVINSSDRLGADEASFKVWSAYQRWRVTKIRLGGILLNQETVTKDSQIFTFPLASSIYSTVLGESMRSRSLTHDS